MADSAQYLAELNQIIHLIEEDKINGEEEALDKFKNHLRNIINIGEFSIDDWSIDWRNAVYVFGTLFKERSKAAFLMEIQELKSSVSENNQEVLYFYICEIECNALFKKNNSYLKKFIGECINSFPINPEFHHSIGNIFYHEKNYSEAIKYYSIAQKLDPLNIVFVRSLFNVYYGYFDTLIENSEYEKGYRKVIDLLELGTFNGDKFYYNYIYGFKHRFRDYIQLNKKLEEAEGKIDKKVSEETQKGQFKIIEILGFFTAIIAFIFSTISIGKNFKFNEAIIFNISLGMNLAIFALIMSLFFSKDKPKILDYRVLMLIVLTGCLILIVVKFGLKIWLA